jgi:hypothetical protein
MKDSFLDNLKRGCLLLIVSGPLLAVGEVLRVSAFDQAACTAPGCRVANGLEIAAVFAGCGGLLAGLVLVLRAFAPALADSACWRWLRSQWRRRQAAAYSEAYEQELREAGLSKAEVQRWLRHLR